MELSLAFSALPRAATNRFPCRIEMSDKGISPERSALMRTVRRRDTAPEMIVRRMLHSRGWRYRLHRKGLPGTPDIVFPSRRKALFVHGCFWHAHDCRLGRAPKTRDEFWSPKRKSNRARDDQAMTALRAIGWDALVIWQCQLKGDLQTTLHNIEKFLGPPGSGTSRQADNGSRGVEGHS